ncbi:MAG: glycosyltransferase family 39 protein, partial [Bacteroidia bacterium]|nr:glycosyltransferase family 39 protein [Bacteroidia bacterium]
MYNPVFNQRHSNILIFILFLIALYFPYFLHLDRLVIREWDEARVAMNAVEMYESGNWLVSKFFGKPDLWNTKPPFLLWLQVICMKFLGINELAVRLPSAIAGFLTSLLYCWFFVRRQLDLRLGILAGLILATSYGFVSEHSTRTGDYDALLTFFLTASLFTWYDYLETKENRILLIFWGCLSLAVLTKSIQGLLLVPTYLLWFFWTKQSFRLMISKPMLVGIGIFLLTVGGFYGIREAIEPGYWKAVWENEIGGRYFSTIENHKQDFWFYFQEIFNVRYSFWFWFAVIGIFIGYFSVNPTFNQLTTYFSVAIFFYWLIISTAQTKLFWYAIPLYPMLSVLAAITLDWLLELADSPPMMEKLKYPIGSWLLLFLIMQFPYRQIISIVYMTQETVDFMKISYVLRSAIRGEGNLQNVRIVYSN